MALDLWQIVMQLILMHCCGKLTHHWVLGPIDQESVIHDIVLVLCDLHSWLQIKPHVFRDPWFAANAFAHLFLCWDDVVVVFLDGFFVS